MGEGIVANLAHVREEMGGACDRVGRSLSEVQLIGVTKTVSIERIREGVQAGIVVLGENYVQEAQKKMGLLSDLRVSWHFIGHLQSNKAKFAAGLFDLIHTVDRLNLARELNKAGARLGRRIPILLQVNVGDESSKSGVHPDGLAALHREVSQMEALQVRGLMALPPYMDDAEAVRPFFRKMRELRDLLREHSHDPGELRELSMGMSHDFAVAIEEGATMIRVGTALFGFRSAGA